MVPSYGMVVSPQNPSSTGNGQLHCLCGYALAKMGVFMQPGRAFVGGVHLSELVGRASGQQISFPMPARILYCGIPRCAQRNNVTEAGKVRPRARRPMICSAVIVRVYVNA